jgi:basic membrane protein A
VNKISRNAFKGLAAAAIATLALTGCSSTTAAPSLNYKAWGVSDEGSWTDKSINESVLDGLNKAKTELGVKLNTAESKSSEDFVPNLQAMVDAKCDVIIAVGFNLVDAVNKAAEANPKMNFVTVDGWSNKATNLKPVTYSMNQSAYLAGYLAAGYSKTHVVGTYGGMKIPAVTDYMDGFYYGAKAFEKASGTATKVLGWDAVKKTGDFMGDFTPNSGVSKTIAANQVKGGADVIMPVAGDQFGAVSAAIKEAKVDGVMIGVDKDIAKTSPQYADMVLTSVEKRMTNAVYDIVKQYSAKGAPAFDGTAYVGTLKNGGTDLSPFAGFDSKVSADLKAALTKLKAGIIDGSVNPLQ